LSLRRAVLPLSVFVLVLLVRLAYLASLHRSALSGWHRWRETDEFTFVDWSRHLAKGNWRDVPAYRASFHWMDASGTPGEWEKRYVPNGYFQGPLYAYLLALVRVTLGHVVTSARLLQALAAALVSALVAAAVRRTAARSLSLPLATAGALVAGLAYGLYGPSVFHDGFLYRDGLLSHASTAFLVLPLLVPAFGPAAAAGVGLGAGLLTLLKQTALPIGLGALALCVLRARGGRRRVAAAGLAGFLLPLGALAARNVSAGVSPFVFDTRQAFTFVWAHGRGAGAMRIPPPESFRILDRTGPGTLRTALAVWRSWEGDRAALAKLELTKILSFFQRLEVPDNASFDFFRDRLPLLRWLLLFSCVLGPGLVGLLAARRAELLTRAEAGHLWLGLFVPLASTVLALSNSRYRLPAIGPLSIGAGLGFSLLAGALRAHPRRAAAGALAALLLSAVTLVPPVDPVSRFRWADALVLVSLEDAHGEREKARAEARRYLEEAKGDLDRRRGRVQLEMWLAGTRGDVPLAPD
jgi:hypothetical protein